MMIFGPHPKSKIEDHRRESDRARDIDPGNATQESGRGERHGSQQRRQDGKRQVSAEPISEACRNEMQAEIQPAQFGERESGIAQRKQTLRTPQPVDSADPADPSRARAAPAIYMDSTVGSVRHGGFGQKTGGAGFATPSGRNDRTRHSATATAGAANKPRLAARKGPPRLQPATYRVLPGSPSGRNRTQRRLAKPGVAAKQEDAIRRVGKKTVRRLGLRDYLAPVSGEIEIACRV